MINYPTHVHEETGPNTERKVRELIDAANKLQSSQKDLTAIVSAIRVPTIEEIKSSLSLGGSNQINVTGLYGVLAQVQPACILGTHAQRLTTSPGSQSLGTLFYETDRTLIYVVHEVSGANAWAYAAGIYENAYASRPAVTAADNGMLFLATNQNVVYVVKAGAWIYVAGLIIGTVVTPSDTRPTLAAGDAGVPFLATDTVQYYIWKGAAWVIPKVTEAEITLADNTTDDVSTARHGFVPKSTNNTLRYLQDGNPPGWIQPDHTAILNIGTNSHSQIDAHIASTTLHVTTGVSGAYGSPVTTHPTMDDGNVTFAYNSDTMKMTMFIRSGSTYYFVEIGNTV